MAILTPNTGKRLETHYPSGNGAGGSSRFRRGERPFRLRGRVDDIASA